MRLEDAEPWLQTRWQGPATTVSGHIISTLGRLPVEGEQLDIEGVGVTISEMGPTAARWVVVQPRVPDDAAVDAEGPPSG
jgi:CBS domain containing-hemolysin-like protein